MEESKASPGAKALLKIAIGPRDCGLVCYMTASSVAVVL